MKFAPRLVDVFERGLSISMRLGNGAIRFVLGVTLLGSVAVHAQSEDRPPTPAGEIQRGEDAGVGGFAKTPDGTLRFHARDLDVAEAFAQLRRLMQKNIVVSPEVRARFTGDLYDMTLEQAVQAICVSTGLRPRYEGEFLFIEPAKLEARIYRLQHATARSVVALLRPLLSDAGKVSTLADPEDERPPDPGDAEVVLVWDFPANHDRVADVVRSVDRPSVGWSSVRTATRRLTPSHRRASDLARRLEPLLSPDGAVAVRSYDQNGGPEDDTLIIVEREDRIDALIRAFHLLDRRDEDSTSETASEHARRSHPVRPVRAPDRSGAPHRNAIRTLNRAPGDLIESERLADLYVRRARELLDLDQPGCSMVLLDAAQELGAASDPIRRMRREVERRMSRSADAAADQLVRRAVVNRAYSGERGVR